MKKTQKILGLPIISISDGMEVGRVKSTIINAERGAIDFIVVDSGIQIFSARVIPNDDILGIGEYALTIENEGVITDISKIPAAIQLLQKDIQVKGTKVLTKKGRLIGERGDIYVDDEDGCKITGAEFISDITQKKVKLIPRDSVITFGKNLTVVNDDVESTLLDTPLQLNSEERLFDFEKKNDGYLSSIINPSPIDSDVAYESDSQAQREAVPVERRYVEQHDEQPVDRVVELDFSEQPFKSIEREIEPEEIEKVEEAPAVNADDDNAALLFEQRQRQYLNGRTVTKTISDSEGNIIISEGMTIDDDVIDEAKAKGKLIELVMNNRS
ncbi:MAG: hypothetical protein HGA22_00285 [Clostridiales bacterium]|nr:hypothetical protein [Clostridiales bacterium]